MVEPFSEIGMVAQVSAIQPVMDQPSRSLCDPSMLPVHLQELLESDVSRLGWLTEGLASRYFIADR